jgi:tripartite-type tricarboxylate transporter receptor subunit TctC
VNIHTIDRNATLSRRILSMSGFSLLLAALFLPLFIAQAPAQTWPARPVSVIVPFTAGTTSDVIARGVAVSHRTIFSTMLLMVRTMPPGFEHRCSAFA